MSQLAGCIQYLGFAIAVASRLKVSREILLSFSDEHSTTGGFGVVLVAVTDVAQLELVDLPSMLKLTVTVTLYVPASLYEWPVVAPVVTLVPSPKL